jgi:hypothetical protein
MPKHRPWLWLWSIPFLLLAPGCNEPVHLGDTKPKASAPAKKPDDDFIVGKKTQEIRNAAEEKKKGGNVVSPRIVRKDPFTLPGNAYVSIIGQNSMLNLKKAIDLYHAENDRYPKDYNEFMDVIIKANNIALPELPKYQKYAYDEPSHSLVIMEYPDLKENQ